MKIRKTICLMLAAGFSCLTLYAQMSPIQIDSLKNILPNVSGQPKQDIYITISNSYRYSDIDSALYYADKAIEYGKFLNDLEAESEGFSQKGFIVLEAGDLPSSLQYQFKALKVFHKAGGKKRMLKQ